MDTMEAGETGEAAILVRGVSKQYGKKSSNVVLNNLDMTVRKGTIYGLLGASGCGKTTLLGAIIGMRQIQNGVISVLGKPPGVAAVKSIGYMPQDIALVGEFTVKGALQHFGWIFGMTNEQIDRRHEFLEKLLDLPPADRFIKHLSGGQQRRVSMAVVLVHDPEVLILDEPTVGLDPLLRQNIWDYLVKITVAEKKTVIITTHYIEEAKQANAIGLMRNGKILAEGSPQYLLDKYDCTTVENMFLLLSRKQKEGNLGLANGHMAYRHCLDTIDQIETSSASSGSSSNLSLQKLRKEKPKKSLWSSLCFTSLGHSKALFSKNILRIARHPGGLLFTFIFPILQISTFFLAIGVVPTDRKIGVVNEELGNITDCTQYKLDHRVGAFLQDDNRTCIFHGLGCKFVDYLGDRLQNTIYFETKEEALKATRAGKIHQFLHFPRNYSLATTLIRNGENEFTDEDLDSRQVDIYQDVMDFTLSAITEKDLVNAYKKFAEALAEECNVNVHSAKFPIAFQEPIYGSEELTYSDFMAPGMLTIVSVFLALSVSSLTVITERTEGVWERTLVAGVTTTEILIFHTITLSLIAFIQIAEVFGAAFYIFQLQCQGDKLVVFFLIYLQALAGICLGVLISVLTKTVTQANYVSLGLFYPYIILTGCAWPLEGMPTALRYVSYVTPATLSVESISHVIHKGWGLSNLHVFKGLLSSVGFICVLALLSIIVLKYENK